MCKNFSESFSWKLIVFKLRDQEAATVWNDINRNNYSITIQLFIIENNYSIHIIFYNWHVSRQFHINGI